MILEVKRKIAFANYYGFGEHLYEDRLGFLETDRQNAGSNVTKDIFHRLLNNRFELGFFYVDNGEYYFIATMENPIQVIHMPRNSEVSQFAGFQCADSYDFGTILATYDTVEDIWNNFRIGDKNLEEVLQRSYITKCD